MRYNPCPPHCYFSCLSIPHIGGIRKNHCQEEGTRVLANCSEPSSCWFFSCSPSRPEMNCSKNTDFVLSGLSSDPDKPQLLFGLFLALYLLSLRGNSLLLLTIDTHPPPHPHVLPQPALPGQPLLHYHHSPLNAGDFVDQQQIDLLLWVSGPVKFLCSFCWYGQPAFDGHSYQLLRCHLPSPALCTPNDSLQMCTAAGWVMGSGPLSLSCPCPVAIPALILY